MMKIRQILTLLGVLLSSSALSQIPSGYYSRIDGESGTDLKYELYRSIKEHKTLGYNSLWQYYPSTYYHLDNKKQIYDMYSDNVRYYNGASAVSNMNKEHTVPKSWWGGSTGAQPGNDLYNVIPSDSEANSRKSNYPLGVVSNVSWSNGVTTVGKGSVNGYSTNFFEPVDKYKGDFARIYFYMATCYPSQSWDSNNANAMTDKDELTLKSWIIPLLIEWHNADPVDETEIQRNEDIYQVQGNRNPFIDYPVLAEYIWGDKFKQAFYLDEHEANQGESGPLIAAIPTFSIEGGTEDTPKEIASGTTISVKGGVNKATLYTSVNGSDWEETLPQKGWNATSETEYYSHAVKDIVLTESAVIRAYCAQENRLNSDTIEFYYDVVNFDDDFILYDEFDDVIAGNNNSTNGSSSLWNGNNNFPTVSKAYQAGGAIKLGSGSAQGSITSRTLTCAGGNISVSIDVKGWTTIEGLLKVSMTGAEPQFVDYSATMADDFETVKLTFEGVTSNPQLTIESTYRRCFISAVKVEKAGGKDDDDKKEDTGEDDEVAIDSIYTISGNSGIYTLTGVRVDRITRPGVYIIDGKRVWMK